MATALVVIVAGAAAVLWSRGWAAWQRVDGGLQQLALMEKGVDTLAHELRRGVVLDERPFEGAADTVAFAIAEEPTRVAQVAYRVVSDGGHTATWVRQWRPYPTPASTASDLGRTKTLVPRVTTVAFQYGALQTNPGATPSFTWTRTWGAAQTPQSRDLPRLIRVQLVAEDLQGRSYTVTRQVWVPHGALGTLSEG